MQGMEGRWTECAGCGDALDALGALGALVDKVRWMRGLVEEKLEETGGENSFFKLFIHFLFFQKLFKNGISRGFLPRFMP
mgnify:CR=1 FL=1